MRLATVDGKTITVLESEYASMEELKKVMRNDPEQFVGEKLYTLLESRPALSVEVKKSHAINEHVFI
jgi:hypothetical protein